MYRLKTRLLLLSAPFLALMAVSVQADLGYTVATTVERADETLQFGEQVLTVGKSARIDFLDANGKPDGTFLVTNDGGKTFALANRSEAYCSDWQLDGFFQSAGRFLNKGSKLVRPELKDVRVEKVLEEPGGEIEGFETTHIRLETSYGGKVQVLFMSWDYEVEEVDDIWMTSELELPEFEELWLNAVAQSGFSYVDEIFSRRLAFETGPVLRLENVVTLRNVKKGEEEVKKETVVVSNLREVTTSDIPPGHFDLPQCKQASKKEMEKESLRMLKKHIR